ncbi:MAG: hypothetical protein N0E44_18290 [Candidatus Thiodiazotropha lotti]|nr:hypothetical protein [Candidatus Thiodiazotropha lotti]MCW4221834.1 hypothetical protein [Candidatus Thiodiazotropha lotti]
MNTQEHLMVVFAEELGEVGAELLDLQKQVFKALRFGIDEMRDLPTTNRQRIEAEWQDLLGAMEKLRTAGIDLKPDIEAINRKMEKVDKYCAYAEELGTLST